VPSSRHVFVFGWPSRLGGADTKLADLLRLLHGSFAITCVPNDPAQLHDRSWTAFLDELGVAYGTLDSLAPRLDGVALSLSNQAFFTAGIAQRAREKGLTVIWSSEMMWHHPGELEAVRAGVVDAVLYVSDLQRAALEPGYAAAAGAGLKWAVTGNYIDEAQFPFADRTGAAFTIGRLSRPDPLKYPEDFPVFYECLLPDARFRVMAWDQALAHKYRWHRFDDRWSLLPPDAERAVEFLHRLDLFVYPLGHRFRESWGRSTAEAMLTGCVPLVAPGDHLEQVVQDGETGFVCRVFDEWRDRARQLQRDAALRRRMAARARAHVTGTLCRKDDHLTIWKAILE
jgi:glycosyltransferase involved in cell wall biosynthesis